MSTPKKPLEIDLEGIEDRIVAFPVEEGRYGRILGSKDGKALFLLYPVEGTLEQDWRPATPPGKGSDHALRFRRTEGENHPSRRKQLRPVTKRGDIGIPRRQ